MGRETGREAPRRLKMPEDGFWDMFFTNGYLVLLGVVTLVVFRTTTMLTEAQIGWLGRYLAEMRLLLLLFVSAKLAWERSWRGRQLLLAVLLCGALLRSWQRVERDYIPELVLLILGAHGVDFKKIVKVHLAVAGAGLLVTMALALTGHAENLVYTRRGQTRMSFGIIYPTDFSAQVFFLAAGWAWLREKRITVWEIGAIAALGVFCYVFCDAKNSTLCLFLLAAGLLYLKLRRRSGERREKPYAMTCPAQWLLALSAPILAAGMILMARFYDREIPWMDHLDDFMSYRLSLGHRGFGKYGVNLFGQYLDMNGLGGTGESMRMGDYFFLDSSYVYILLGFGLVTLLCVLAAMTVPALRERRSGAWERLGILALVAVHCTMEHHLLEIPYNVFLLLPLAVSGLNGAETNKGEGGQGNEAV